jgi:hypothetical protein
MRRFIPFVAAGLLTAPAMIFAQAPAQRPPARRPATPPPGPPPTVAPADITCPSPLGIGVTTKMAFCDVLSSRVPADGALIKLPPHRGPVTLTFDLHNRHTYSEEQVKANRAFAHYTASIGVLTMDNTLVARAAIDSEFRTTTDLVDRIGGGAGAGGVKAVAPTGTEHITVVIPKEENQVSILGEKVTVTDGSGQRATYSLTGRPIAVISNAMLEYVPAPPPKPPAAPAPVRKK